MDNEHISEFHPSWDQCKFFVLRNACSICIWINSLRRSGPSFTGWLFLCWNTTNGKFWSSTTLRPLLARSSRRVKGASTWCPSSPSLGPPSASTRARKSTKNPLFYSNTSRCGTKSWTWPSIIGTKWMRSTWKSMTIITPWSSSRKRPKRSRRIVN